MWRNSANSCHIQLSQLICYRPGVAGGAALVASRVLCLDRKRVVPHGQARIFLWARADTVPAAVKLTEEAHLLLRIAEAEAGAGLLRRVGRLRSNDRLGRRCSVNGPRETSGAAPVAGSILRPH